MARRQNPTRAARRPPRQAVECAAGCSRSQTPGRARRRPVRTCPGERCRRRIGSPGDGSPAHAAAPAAASARARRLRASSAARSASASTGQAATRSTPTPPVKVSRSPGRHALPDRGRRELDASGRYGQRGAAEQRVADDSTGGDGQRSGDRQSDRRDLPSANCGSARRSRPTEDQHGGPQRPASCWFRADRRSRAIPLEATQRRGRRHRWRRSGATTSPKPMATGYWRSSIWGGPPARMPLAGSPGGT